MAIGKASDFKVYQEYFQTRVNETLTQNGNAFNAASRGAVGLTTASKRGDYEYRAFFKNISGIISRRDTTSTSAATALAMTQDEMISVKLNRKIGPVDQTMDSFRKIVGRFSQTEFSGLLGEQAAVEMQLEMLNSGLRGVRAALLNQSGDYGVTHTGSATITTTDLVDGLAKFGDRADRVVCWFMHSKVFFELVKQQITANIDGVSSFNVAQATPITLNRPVIVTDSDALRVSLGSPTQEYTYYTLGLTSGAVLLENSETESVFFDDVLGYENVIARMQGEFAYNIGVKGFKWDVSNGGANPNDTALGTGSNWDRVMNSPKDFAGVVIKTGENLSA